MHAQKVYSIDYLKVRFDIADDLFQQIYAHFRVLMTRKWGGSVSDMEKCHKVNVFHNRASKRNYYIIDIWDIGSEIFYDIAEQYGNNVQRVDIRHSVPAATKDDIIDSGHFLQKGVTSWNVNVYNTKPASKRMGRDRGGIGFAIGSHKSDLRVTKYIRGREQGALEYQVQGKQLRKALELAREEKAATATPLGVGDLWADNLDAMGHHRYTSALNQANTASTQRTEALRQARMLNLSQAPLWESDANRNISPPNAAPLQSEGAEEGALLG